MHGYCAILTFRAGSGLRNLSGDCGGALLCRDVPTCLPDSA